MSRHSQLFGNRTNRAIQVRSNTLSLLLNFIYSQTRCTLDSIKGVQFVSSFELFWLMFFIGSLDPLMNHRKCQHDNLTFSYAELRLKLDGVGPVDNTDPPTASFTTLFNVKNIYIYYIYIYTFL